MERVIKLDADDLAWGLSLSPQDRLRQANAAFRLYHAVHRPFARPEHIGFDTLEAYWRYDKEPHRRR
jgi:hypothetical protein